ncbi:hypothetical protein LOK74_00540 [Brevibacillus humidisoli]|uniref:hypothetical protein n=1 Tax=Brevibacillus humidisoli TaxID=2895522 RepID=UPI001E3EEA3F|nr:hypothetical protein [Brevibacillus humidisoli]UFJ41086.1 hypothetical protein LOK74_00540 [Brevibacillus humidisoli]
MNKFKKWGVSLLSASLAILMTTACSSGGTSSQPTASQPAASGGDSKPTYTFKLAHITPPSTCGIWQPNSLKKSWTSVPMAG